MGISAKPSRTSELLANIAQDESCDSYSFSELLQRFHHRAFGVLLLFLTLPNFIPAPVGVGGVMGVMVLLLGTQLMFDFDHPWLPKWLGNKRMQRSSFAKLQRPLGKVLSWMERLTKPRLPGISGGLALRFTGLMLVLLGLALSLPIPLTNYPFGLVLLAYSIAMIERDGAMMLFNWILGIVVLGVFFVAGPKAILSLFEQIKAWWF